MNGFREKQNQEMLLRLKERRVSLITGVLSEWDVTGSIGRIPDLILTIHDPFQEKTFLNFP